MLCNAMHSMLRNATQCNALLCNAMLCNAICSFQALKLAKNLKAEELQQQQQKKKQAVEA